MLNQELAKIFETFAHIHEIRDAKNDFFRVRSYTKAAEILNNLPEDITTLIDLEKNKLTKKIPGIGEAITHKIIEYHTTKEIQELNELKKEIPNGLLEILELKNVGPKKVKRFYKELGIETIPQLKKAIQTGTISNMKGLGEKSAQKILESIEHREEYGKRTPIGLIFNKLEEIKQTMAKHPKSLQVEIAGSARRFRETIGDVDLLVSCKSEDRQEILQFFQQQDFLRQIEASGDTKITARLHNGVQIDLRVVDPDEFGAALQYFTGSQVHNVNLRTIAKQQNYKINEYGIFQIKDDKEIKVGGEEEKDIYNTLGLQFIPPEIRLGNNEIELASQNNIPKLVQQSDIKGELHCHSTYSDGKNSIQEMAEKAIQLGYEYIAITDHSPNLKVANGLDKDALLLKKKEIEEVKQKLNFPILFGTEVDILLDGSIDYDNKTLSEFDFVIASIHTGLTNNPNERILKAIQHPYVNMIGHPTTQLIGKRPPNELNWPEIFQACKDHNTFLEINAQPLRLDTPAPQVRQAIQEFGLKFAITTDGHDTKGLELMKLGAGYARRGWATKEDIINTYAYKDFLKLIKK